MRAAAGPFRPIPDFPSYEINRRGTLRRDGRVLKGHQLYYGVQHFLQQDGQKLGTTTRALLAKVFGPDAVPPWRYHIVLHPDIKIHLGESNGNSRLTEEQVLDMRARYASGAWSHRKLARTFGVCRSTVCQILTNRTWRHIQ